jgi:hypothetical protein
LTLSDKEPIKVPGRFRTGTFNSLNFMLIPSNGRRLLHEKAS